MIIETLQLMVSDGESECVPMGGEKEECENTSDLSQLKLHMTGGEMAATQLRKGCTYSAPVCVLQYTVYDHAHACAVGYRWRLHVVTLYAVLSLMLMSQC